VTQPERASPDFWHAGMWKRGFKNIFDPGMSQKLRDIKNQVPDHGRLTCMAHSLLEILHSRPYGIALYS
jgi:hypothetical protein